jgi:hypothetical protein
VTVPVVVILALVLGQADKPDKKTATHSGSAVPTPLSPITVAAPPPNAAADAPCTKLLGTLPITLAGLAGRPARSSWTYVAAWGDPAIVLRCGVPRPGGLKAGSSEFVLGVNGVNFFQTRPAGAHVFTAVDRVAYIEVSVPESYAQPPLGPIADAIAKALPAVCVPAAGPGQPQPDPRTLCTHRR